MTDQERNARDTLWDAMRAFATVRVVAWHTWRWAPLSWVAAMPAMFFTAGVLLEGSVARHGWSSTVRTRLRRLLVPFWLYAATSAVVMVSLGWRPGFGESWQWVLPLGDPVGSSEAPSLWIPLWYLRAYLWFVVASGVLAWLAARLRWWAVASVAALAVAQQWVWSGAPMAVSDGVVYAVFVVAGMVVSIVGMPRSRWLTPVSVVAAGATAVAMASGRASTVVNESYLVTAAAGVATVGLLLAVASRIRGFAAGVGAGVVDWLGRRALSVYLWQGLGLFAADRLVTRRGVSGAWGVVASGLVVAVVTVAMAVVTGPLEDLAARRHVRLPARRTVPALAVSAVLVVAAFVVTPLAGTRAALPLSGQAVVANADAMHQPDNTSIIHIDPGASTTTAPPVDDTVFDAEVSAARDERVIAFLDGWAIEHADNYAEVDQRWIEMAVTTPDGETSLYRWTKEGGAARVDSLPTVNLWRSEAKAVTTGWLMSLVQQGVVRLDDPVGKYLPEVPHGDTITLEHLARHLSGIPSSADTPSDDGLDVGADVRRWMRTGELAGEPGAGFNYSRVGYALLAWALERASGTSWQAAVAAMASAAGVDVQTDDADVSSDAANHHPGEGTYRGSLYSSGGVESTAADLARFYQWLYSDRLTAASWSAVASASNRYETFQYGLGVDFVCPCTDDGSTVRARVVGHSAERGWWVHDTDHDVTVVFVPSTAALNDWFNEVITGSATKSAALAAVLGP